MKPEEKAKILEKHKDRLSEREYGTDQYSDMIFIASVITSACRELNIEIPVVVGGLAVEIYTSGGYTTHDIDFITNSESGTREVMEGLGFTRRFGYRYWSHPLFGDVVEFPTPPLAGSPDRITIIKLDNGEECHLIGIEDIIISRLEEFVHWDKKSLESQSSVQLRLLIRGQEDEIDFEYLRRKASGLGIEDALDLILANKD